MLVHDMIPAGTRKASVGSLVELFFDIAEAVEIDGFIEAGAKDAGASRRAANDLGVDEVVAFEANPYTFRRFDAEVTANGVQYEHLALSDSPGKVEFLVRLDEGGRPMADGQGSLLVRPDHTPGYESVEVESVTLDGFFVASTATTVAMWVDVEGAASSVLSGAPQVLSRTDVVMIELEEDRAWVGQKWLHDDVVRFFSEHQLRPIARDTQSRRQFNVVFVSDRVWARPAISLALSAWRDRRGSAIN